MTSLTLTSIHPTSSGIVLPKIGTLIPNRIFVGGITSTTTEDDLRNIFGGFGPIKDVKIIYDKSGLSKGSYGFVTFEHRETAEMIIKNEAKSLIFNDRKLNIGYAVRKQTILSGQVLTQAFLPCPMQPGISFLSVNNQDLSTMSCSSNSLCQSGLFYQQINSMGNFSGQGITIGNNPNFTHANSNMPDGCTSNDSSLNNRVFSEINSGMAVRTVITGGSILPPGSLLYTHSPMVIANGPGSQGIEVVCPQNATLVNNALSALPSRCDLAPIQQSQQGYKDEVQAPLYTNIQKTKESRQILTNPQTLQEIITLEKKHKYHPNFNPYYNSPNMIYPSIVNNQTEYFHDNKINSEVSQLDVDATSLYKLFRNIRNPNISNAAENNSRTNVSHIDFQRNPVPLINPNREINSVENHVNSEDYNSNLAHKHFNSYTQPWYSSVDSANSLVTPGIHTFQSNKQDLLLPGASSITERRINPFNRINEELRGLYDAVPSTSVSSPLASRSTWTDNNLECKYFDNYRDTIGSSKFDSIQPTKQNELNLKQNESLINENNWQNIQPYVENLAGHFRIEHNSNLLLLNHKNDYMNHLKSDFEKQRSLESDESEENPSNHSETIFNNSLYLMNLENRSIYSNTPNKRLTNYYMKDLQDQHIIDSSASDANAEIRSIYQNEPNQVMISNGNISKEDERFVFGNHSKANEPDTAATASGDSTIRNQ